MTTFQFPLLPEKQLALALAFSVLLHILLLWLPYVTLPHNRLPLPLLTVRLEAPVRQSLQLTSQQQEPQQQFPKQPAAPRPPQASREPAPPSPPVASKPGTTQAKLSEKIRARVFAPQEVKVPAAALHGQGLPIMASTPYDKTQTPALPLHAHLRFAVYLNDSNIPIGDMFQELDINGNQYTLQSQLAKGGMGSLVSRFEILQSSRGTLTDLGMLVPDEFREDSTAADGTQRSISAAFHWADQKLVFADGTSIPLVAGTQDMLSFMYQLSRFSFNTEIIPITLTDGNKLEGMRFEVSTYDEIDTPMGKILTMHLRKMHRRGEPWMEIWLGVDYRLLPVKFQKIDADGKVSEEMDIREIRSSDNP
jgi:Protein of unknown function (DUF3108)